MCVCVFVCVCVWLCVCVCVFVCVCNHGLTAVVVWQPTNCTRSGATTLGSWASMTPPTAGRQRSLRGTPTCPRRLPVGTTFYSSTVRHHAWVDGQSCVPPTHHSLRVRVAADGQVYSMGSNRFGQLGVGDTVDRWTPVAVPGFNRTQAVISGNYYSLAVQGTGGARATVCTLCFVG